MPLFLLLAIPVQVAAEATVGDLLHQESFQSYSNGQDPPDWLDEAPGLFLARTLADGNIALSVTASLDGIDSHLDDPNASGWSSYELRGRMRMDDPVGALGVTLYGDSNAARYYRLGADSTGSFRLEGSAGALFTGSLDTGVPLETGVWYRFRLQAFADVPGPGTRLRARVWRDGTPEPPGWPVDCVDTSPDAPDAGGIGVWSYFGAALGGSYWDDFEVYQLEVAAHASERVWAPDYYVHSDLLRPTFSETVAQVRALASGATTITFRGDPAFDDSYCPIRFRPRRVLEFGPGLPVWEELSSYSFDLPPGVFLYPQRSGSIAPANGANAKVAVGPQFSRRDGDWALAHELGHNAGLSHTSEITVMVGAQSVPGTGHKGVVLPWQCEMYLDAAVEGSGKVPCILYDAERLLQGLDPNYPAPRWSPCGGGVSGFCDGQGVCVPTQPACFEPSGGAPKGTDCSYRGLCAVCTGYSARCVPCGSGRGNEISGSCGDGVVDPGEDCDDANFYDGDGCGAYCRFTPAQAAFSADSDGDGVSDWIDPCPADPAAEHYDSDGDGLGDGCDPCPHDADPNRQAPCDPDGDGDGISDLIDLCPDLPSANNDDPDLDGFATPCDVCPQWPDLDQKDSNGDGVGDACTCGDATNDGIISASDAYRIFLCVRGLRGGTQCDATIADTDADGRLTSRDAFRVYQATAGTIDPGSFTCARSGG